MSIVKGKKVLVRKAQQGDVVISRTTGREYKVDEVHKQGNRITGYAVTSTAYRGLPNHFRPQDVAVLAKKA